MNVLVVGAGAVGAVYAYHAQLAGAEITFLIKPKHRTNLTHDIQLYRHATFGKKTQHILFKNFSLIDNPTQVSEKKWDMIFITVPSNAIREGDWLKTLVENSGDATVISLQPGIADRDTILNQTGIPDSRLVSASIPILSYLAPLPGEELEKPGFAFWTPPGGCVCMSLGEDSRRIAAVELLEKGGMKSKSVPDYRKENIVGETILRLVVAGLEKSDWSWQRFQHGENLILTSDSVREVLPIIAHLRGVKDPSDSFLKSQMIRPFAIRSLMRLLAFITPFDVEAFFRVHFTKVEAQMHQGILDLISEGKKLHHPTTTLSMLVKRK